MTPFERVTAEVRLELGNAIHRLTARELAVIQLRFGLHGPPCTLQSTANLTGISSRERVRQIEAKALRKIRTSSDLHHHWPAHIIDDQEGRLQRPYPLRPVRSVHFFTASLPDRPTTAHSLQHPLSPFA
jgi:hypothetical protein